MHLHAFLVCFLDVSFIPDCTPSSLDPHSIFRVTLIHSPFFPCCYRFHALHCHTMPDIFLCTYAPVSSLVRYVPTLIVSSHASVSEYSSKDYNRNHYFSSDFHSSRVLLLKSQRSPYSAGGRALLPDNSTKRRVGQLQKVRGFADPRVHQVSSKPLVSPPCRETFCQLLRLFRNIKLQSLCSFPSLLLHFYFLVT